MSREAMEKYCAQCSQHATCDYVKIHRTDLCVPLGYYDEGYTQAEQDTRGEIAKQLAKQWSDGYSEGYTKAEQDLKEKFKMWVAHNGYTAKEAEAVYNDFKQFITEN